jgi:hypothetical protein
MGKYLIEATYRKSGIQGVLKEGASGAASLKTTVLLDASTVDAATQKTTGYRAPGA